MQRIVLVFALCLLISPIQAQFQYDEETAKNLAGFSVLAYCNKDKIALNTCGEPCKRFPSGLQDHQMLINESSDTQAIVGYSQDHQAIIITFRGTLSKEINNWLYNAMIFKVEYPLCSNLKCKVHDGFNKHYTNIKDQLQKSFLYYRNKYPSAKVFMTGHSLGGAMATLAIPFIYELNNRRQIDAFYTFGCPRVGNQEFADWFKTKNFAKQQARVTHGEDPIPHFAPSFFPFYYRHIDQEVYYDDFTKQTPKYKLCQGQEDPTCIKDHHWSIEVEDHRTYFWNITLEKKKCK